MMHRACQRVGPASRHVVASHRQPVSASASLLGRRCFADGADGKEAGAARQRRLWRWGNTNAGRVMQADAIEVSKDPTLMEGVQGVTAVACGSSHSAFVVDGQLFTFGSNKYHQLGRDAPPTEAGGLGAEPAPVEVVAEDGHRPRVLDVALGAYHSAIITEGGALWTWGWGGSFLYGAGALGQGSRDSVAKPKLVQRFVEQGEEVRQVVCGQQHTIVLTDQGRIYTTGKGDFGRLGRGETRDEMEFEEVEYFAQSNDSVLNPNDPTSIIKVGAGSNFSAALSRDGELWVWGRNDYGQLGLGEEAVGDMYSAERYPRLVRSLPLEGHRIVDFACGEQHIVALTSAGALYEWGSRLFLEPRPVTLPSRYEDGLKGIVKVAAGEKFSFALTADGKLYSWGAKASGCLVQDADCPNLVAEPTPVRSESFRHQRVVDIAASKYRCLAVTLETEFAP